MTIFVATNNKITILYSIQLLFKFEFKCFESYSFGSTVLFNLFDKAPDDFSILQLLSAYLNDVKSVVIVFKFYKKIGEFPRWEGIA